MENNVFDGIFKLIGRWERKVHMKNHYIFAEEEIDLDDFRDLLQKTFDTIKAVKNEYIFKNIYPDAGDMINFIELISVLSQYGIDDQTVGDESENCAFTATVLLAEELRLYASQWHLDRADGQAVYSDFEDSLTGDLRFELSYYVDLKEDEEDKMYTYNVYDGNFDEILEFAKRIAV
jgi:hypothetical protein